MHTQPYFRGQRTAQTCTVWYGSGLTDGELMLPPFTNIESHSQTGFEWGYAGAGPRQLSLAILTATLIASHACPHLRALTDPHRPKTAPYAPNTMYWQGTEPVWLQQALQSDAIEPAKLRDILGEPSRQFRAAIAAIATNSWVIPALSIYRWLAPPSLPVFLPTQTLGFSLDL